MIARSIILLKAELVLVDVGAYIALTEDDKAWTAVFLRSALAKSFVKRSARVINESAFDQKVYDKVMQAMGPLPYEVRLFTDEEAAKRWLLDEIDFDIADERNIHIPLNCNLKLVRSELLKRATANTRVAPEQIGQLTNTPAPLPDLLQVRADFVSIVVDSSHDLMSIRWRKAPQSRQYRYGMLKAIRALTEHRLEHLLLNNQRMGVLTLEDQAWIINTSCELLPKTRLRKIAVVMSTNSMQQLSSEMISKKLRQANTTHTTQHFFSEEDAREWLLSDNKVF